MKTTQPYGQLTKMAITFSLGGGAEQNRIETDITEQGEFETYLLRFRQFISDGEPVFIGYLLGRLPKYVQCEDLGERLHAAQREWKHVQSSVSPLGQFTLGQFYRGRDLSRLYLNGGLFHSDPELTGVWDSMDANHQAFVTHAFRLYEARVRDVIIELKRVLDEAAERNCLELIPNP